MLMSTAAIAGTVEKLISRKNTAPKTNFFILVLLSLQGWKFCFRAAL